MTATHWLNVAYLAASVLFILGLKGLTHPRTAVRGNYLGAVAMLLAVAVTLFDQRIVSFHWIALGVVVGAAAGVYLAATVQMTGMPELVAAFNGVGGGASMLVAGAALYSDPGSMDVPLGVATALSALIGAVTFTGSFVAFGKLKGLLPGQQIRLPAHNVLCTIVAAVCVLMTAFMALSIAPTFAYWWIVVAASVLGVLLTLPIGGADMPVVIALLNSYSGVAASATGFVLQNNVLIIAGSLVGASGIILTQIMCKAMNRSLVDVLFGTLAAAEGGPTDALYEGRVKTSSPEEVAMLFEGARKVVIVPGYGLAVSQGQHAVRDLAQALTDRKIDVEFAIHPVAGRMPGHMNVLLAEADIDYSRLRTMEEANPEFDQADVVLVIGANDVVNPLARTDPKSPIAGMPILDVDKARTVVVIKRSLSPGFAGIPNPLFAADNTLMLFGDGKKALLGLIAAVKESG
jgi:NAD(P) transhydrogenase subunit beta